MKNLIFILLVIFTFCSCASDGAGFKQISKKEVMESWAWKIFIFTDIGEIASVDTVKVNFGNTIEDKSIFVEDIWQNYKNGSFFLNHQNVAFNDAVSNANFIETAMNKFSSYKNERAVPDNQILNTFSEEIKTK
jgi:PBP1b-binding outer membrane lipoprotein LpoB